MTAQEFIEKTVREQHQKYATVLGLTDGAMTASWHVHRAEELPDHFVLRFKYETPEEEP